MSSVHFKRLPEVYAPTSGKRSHFTQGTAEPCQFSPAELVV
jgi:hypothetical protein